MVGVLNGITNFPVRQPCVTASPVQENMVGEVLVVYKLFFINHVPDHELYSGILLHELNQQPCQKASFVGQLFMTIIVMTAGF